MNRLHETLIHLSQEEAKANPSSIDRVAPQSENQIESSGVCHSVPGENAAPSGCQETASLKQPEVSSEGANPEGNGGYPVKDSKAALLWNEAANVR